MFHLREFFDFHCLAGNGPGNSRLPTAHEANSPVQQQVWKSEAASVLLSRRGFLLTFRFQEERESGDLGF